DRPDEGRGERDARGDRADRDAAKRAVKERRLGSRALERGGDRGRARHDQTGEERKLVARAARDRQQDPDRAGKNCDDDEAPCRNLHGPGASDGTECGCAAPSRTSASTSSTFFVRWMSSSARTSFGTSSRS